MVKEYKQLKQTNKEIFKNKEVIYKDGSAGNHQPTKKKKDLSNEQTDTD